MRRLILGTAGHIDHGKTALVKALTGVDTDRLKEEKERGITVDLGFAEYQPREDILFGVVDVPGHEGFIRNMVAGATGMDLVLLVVAADEGVMPQTREHLSIVRLLRVPRLAVAVTKSDLVEPDWMELVREDVQLLLSDTPYDEAPIIPVSSLSGEGLPELGEALAELGLQAHEKGSDDVVRLPVDRVFTIRGAGTVVTGTLWSGRLVEGARVLVLPGEKEGRVRSVQVHGEEVSEARAGARAAVGLTGSKLDHHEIHRGQCVVQAPGWEASWMLTCCLSMLPDTGWELEQGQRVRVHLGTAEVLARAAVFEAERITGGNHGWVQLRLEEPVLARVRDFLVIRSYSPVTTIGGGQVAEVHPRKRGRLHPGEGELLEGRISDSEKRNLSALLEMAGWDGVPKEKVHQRTGLSPTGLKDVVRELEKSHQLAEVDERFFSDRVWRQGREVLVSSLSGYHEQHPLRPGMPLEELRQVVPGNSGQKVAEALIQDLVSVSEVVVRGGMAALGTFRPTLSPRQKEVRGSLRALLADAGLAPPNLKELEETLGQEEDVENILRLMENQGDLINLDGEFFFDKESIHSAAAAVISALGGKQNLGPADFREVLPITRRHLLPILRHFDLVGVTTRIGDSRDVAGSLPAGWGTTAGAKQ